MLTILESTGESLFLELSGSLDLAGVREIETRFLAQTTNTTRSVVVDFSQVTFLASYGMRMIFDAIRALSLHGRKLIILNPQPFGRKDSRNRGCERRRDNRARSVSNPFSSARTESRHTELNPARGRHDRRYCLEFATLSALSIA
jgi:anti-anti-sigma factor